MISDLREEEKMHEFERKEKADENNELNGDIKILRGDIEEKDKKIREFIILLDAIRNKSKLGGIKNT